MRIEKSVFIRFCLAALMAVSTAVVGCGSDGAPGADGMDGADGADGMDGADGVDGMDGEPGPPAGNVWDVGNDFGLESLIDAGVPLVADIQDVTVASPPVVQFTVTTEDGTGVTGINPSSIRGTFAKLVAAADGKRSRWVSYINSQETTDDPAAIPNPPGTRQATREEGTVQDNGDGSYTFTYTTDPTTSTDPSWEPTLTHRAGLEIRIDDAINPDNPTFDLVPNGSDVSDTKDIADTNLCNNCHQRLALHGDGRFTVEYCVTCHNDQTRDQGYGESLDMAHMVHAIHAAEVRADQETVEGEFAYKVLGRSPHDYSEVTYPRSITDCASCHMESEDTPDGDDWQVSVDSLSCGGCHVAGLTVGEPDATTGLSVYSYTHNSEGGGAFAGEQQDGACATQCHSAGAAEFHVNLVAEEAKKFAFRIDSVELGATGAGGAGGAGGASGGPWDGSADITFTVFNPNDDLAYDITAVEGPFADTRARLRLRVAWSTDDYSNHDSGSIDGNGEPFTIDALNDCKGGIECVKNLDDSFTVTMSIEPPEITGDSIGIAMEGRARVDVDEDGSVNSIPITSQIAYANAEDVSAEATPRRAIVSIDRCNDCHGIVTAHGSNRTNNVQVCATCHNANATDEGINAASVDMKVMIHGIHSSNASFGDGADTFFEVTYPRPINQCQACHLEGTWYPVEVPDDFRLASSTDLGLDVQDPEDDVNTTFNAAACGGCHVRLDNPDTPTDESLGNTTRAAHLMQNGSSFDVTQLIDGTLDPFTVESCTICHGPGRTADVGVVHADGGE